MTNNASDRFEKLSKLSTKDGEREIESMFENIARIPRPIENRGSFPGLHTVTQQVNQPLSPAVAAIKKRYGRK